MKRLRNIKDMYLINSFRFGKSFCQEGKYTYEQLNTFINTDGYIPVASGSELDALRNTTTQQMGAGTPWQGDYLTGLDKKYVQIYNIDISAYSDWSTLVLSGIYDGNLVEIQGHTQIAATTKDGLFNCGSTSGDRIIRNVKITNSSVSVPGAGQQMGVLTGYVGDGFIIEDCEVSGLITTEDNGGWLGGIAGHNYGIVRRCKSEVVINAATATTQLYYGSVVGINRNTGVIQNCYGTGDVTGYRYAGSLVGYNLGGAVENCYGIGAVSASLNAGGLMGANTGTVTASYYDTNTTGQSDTGKGDPKTTTEMQQGSIPDTGIYVGWDSNVWDAVDNANYPILKSLQI